MAVKDTVSERHARKKLAAQGFRVERIPRASGRTADYGVSDEFNHYLIEVIQPQALTFLSDLEGKARQEGISSGTRAFSEYSGKIKDIVYDKSSQLRETAAHRPGYRILWLASPRMKSKLFTVKESDCFARQLERKLYGTVRLNVFGATDKAPELRRCFYYNPFLFDATCDLNAVIFATPRGYKLFVNALNADADSFRITKLYSLFMPSSVVDPRLHEQDGRTLFVSLEADRSSPGAQWNDLARRYGIQTSVTIPYEWHGMATVE